MQMAPSRQLSNSADDPTLVVSNSADGPPWQFLIVHADDPTLVVSNSADGPTLSAF